MAITNAQQYKQLLAKGGRIGFKGGADAKDYKSTPGPKTSAFSSGYQGAKQASDTRREAQSTTYDSPPQQFVTTQDDVRTNIITGGGGRNDEPKTNIEKFIDAPSNYPGYIPPSLKIAADFNRIPNRKFLVDKVLRSKNASKIITDALGLDDDGLSYTVDQLTEAQLEKVMDSYMDDRMSGATDAYGNPLSQRDDGPDQPIIPIIPEPVEPGEGDDEQTSLGGGRDMGGLAPRFAGSIFDFMGLADGGRVPAMGGGIMNTDIVGGFADGSIDEMGRQMYGLGKLVKKATRGIKKIVKSPIGKAALIGAGFGFAGMGPFKSLAGSKMGLGLKDFLAFGNVDKAFNVGSKAFKFGNFLTTPKGAMTGIAALSALPLLFGQDDEEEYDSYRGPSIDIANIRANPYNFLAPRFRGTAADGGIMRTGYQEGGDAEPVAKKTMPLIDMDGKEKDYRETGGFVDMGRMERADDVPARLSKNEFVFTADAVRNAGDGDIDKGAEVMYNMMKNLEDGGNVSEESQGLEGARNMFQTSQRLEEVL